MRFRVPLAIAALASILGAFGAAADPAGRFAYITPTAGFALFDGDIKAPTASLKDVGFWGGRVGFQYLHWLGFEVAGDFASTRENALGGSDISYWHASGNLALTPWRGVLGNPFLSVGFGKGTLSPKNSAVRFPNYTDDAGDQSQGNLEGALGWTAWVTDRWGVRLEGRDVVWMSKDKVDQGLTHTMLSSVALTYALGSRPRDSDGDRVPDRADRCPDTPKGATVDAAGCPKDSDGDGVLDGLDRCPDTPKGARIDAHGCPTDADGDGVPDGIDQCADTPKGATVDAKGCPSDADGDGVLDGLDQCASTPKGARIDDKGCPIDSDHDGVPDGLDQCPDTESGVAVDSVGCPIGFHEREQELLDTGKIRLQNVQFEFGKADLKPESRPILDAVGDLLGHWQELKIEIGGHTDSKGTAKLNQKLSQARADTVRAYLLQRFPKLNPAQFTTKGYGASKPIVSNDTEATRALNRRVEFVVLNQGVLQQEIEKRSKPTPAPSDTTQTPEGGK
jgi:outer membrane protein OmpA-like peptidoglycan-associated protein